MTNGGRVINSSDERNVGYTHSDHGQDDASNYGIKVGSVILHSRFGKGQVKKIEGNGENCKATIDFEETSTKFCSLGSQSLKYFLYKQKLSSFSNWKGGQFLVSAHIKGLLCCAFNNLHLH